MKDDYLHLFQHLARLTPGQQAATLATPSAMLSYCHVNLHGEAQSLLNPRLIWT